MKLQYLGDSKDSFKWDYHDYLAGELELPILKIALMMTPDDQSKKGKSHPTLFPARKEIIEFCEILRRHRDIDLIRKLPEKTNSSYNINLHQGMTCIKNENRKEYFSGFSNERQLLFLDPDNGFEPEKSFGEEHVLYSDMEHILEQLSEESLVSVFQHSRRKRFVDDFARIKERLGGVYATAIYWHSLMFVIVSNSEQVIKKVADANRKYAKNKPVKAIA